MSFTTQRAVGNSNTDDILPECRTGSYGKINCTVTMDNATRQPLDNLHSNFSMEINQRYCANFTSSETQPPRIAVVTLTSYVQPSISCFGIIGNIMILIVLTRYRMRNTVNSSEKVIHAGLLAMAVSDLLFNIAVLPRAFVARDAFLVPTGSFELLYNLYEKGLTHMFSLMSTWLIVVMAGLRYVGICLPFRARSLIKRKSIFVIIGVIGVLCALENIPQFWTFMSIPVCVENGVIMHVIDIGAIDPDYISGKIYTWMCAFFSIFIPGLLLIYFNTCLLIALHKSRELHRESSNVGDEANSRLTWTLVAVVVMFIMLVYPKFLLDFTLYIVPTVNVADSTESVMIARAVVDTLHIANFAFNFVLYFVVNRSFRRTFRDLFICKTDVNQKPTTNTACTRVSQPLMATRDVTEDGQRKACIKQSCNIHMPCRSNHASTRL